jgi:hypothetical protein
VSNKNVPGDAISTCLSPNAKACTSKDNFLGIVANSLIASDTTLYFKASINGAEANIYSCPTVGLGSCVPTAINLPSTLSTAPRSMAAFEDDIFFSQPGGAPPNTNATLRKCAKTGCSTTGTILGTLPGNITELTVDASGAYWIFEQIIQMCPLTGCVGGPVELVNSLGAPQMLRLNKQSVYWVNGNDNTMHRVAKPAP